MKEAELKCFIKKEIPQWVFYFLSQVTLFCWLFKRVLGKGGGGSVLFFLIYKDEVDSMVCSEPIWTYL